MALTVPSNPKVKTTVYENFRGVDYTNDATNIWYRRSPDGVNMLPDESGRPFKRNGWEIMLSNADICDALSLTTENLKILKTAYFELAGKDHLAIFTEAGLVIYNGSVTAISTVSDCYLSHDRCFFFEGNGTSAFYIYGNYRVWKYWYDTGYHFDEVTDNLTVPTVLISASADGTGTTHEAYNMLGNDIYVQYHDCDLFAYWGSDGLTLSVDKDTFISGKTQGNPATYTYTYTSNAWSPTLASGITVSGQSEGDTIYIIYGYGVVLPNNLALSQYDDMEVLISSSLQFDTSLEVINTGTPTTSQCLLIPDPTDRDKKKAWIMFNSGTTFADLGEEDIIRIKTPSVGASSTTKTISASTYSNATLVGEAV